MHTFSRTVTYTVYDKRTAKRNQCGNSPRTVHVCGASPPECGGASSWSGVESRDLNHDPYFDTQATLPTTVPIAHGRHPTHRPRRPAAARGRGRPLALSIPSVHRRVLPYARASSSSKRVLPYPSHSRVSLYCCVVVSHSARLSIPSFFLLPHARASSDSMLVLPYPSHPRCIVVCCVVVSLYRCAVVSRCLVVSLCRCISLSRCIVVPLYLAVSLHRCAVVSRCLVVSLCRCISLSRCVVVSRGLVPPMYLARS